MKQKLRFLGIVSLMFLLLAVSGFAVADFDFTGSDINGTTLYQHNIYVSVNVSGIGTFANSTINLYDASGLEATNFTTDNPATYNFTSLPYGTYYLNVTSLNSTGSSFDSATRTYTLAARPGDITEDISGLSETGTDVGGFLTNIAPGIGVFIFLIALFGGIALIITNIAGMIRGKIEK